MPRRLRLLLVCLLGFAAAALARGADVAFLRVWPGWKDADSFDRIGEYFGRGEVSGRQIVLRTQAAERAGYYFLVRVKSAARVEAGRFELHVIRPDTPETKTFTFTAGVPEKETVFQLGLTGSDWPDGEKASPVAWKITLFAADGRLLAEHKSFLWEKPAK